MLRAFKAIGLVIASGLGAVVVLVVGHWILSGLMGTMVGSLVTLAAVLVYVVAVVVFAARTFRR